MGSYHPSTLISEPLLPLLKMDRVSIQEHLSSFSSQPAGKLPAGKMIQHLHPIDQTLQVTSLGFAPKSFL